MKYYSPSTQGFYDTDVGYDTLPEDCIEITDQAYRSFLEKMNFHNKQLEVIEGKLVLVDRPTVITWEDIRVVRDRLLRESDYTQFSDWPGSNREQWRQYRQILRDIPQTFAKPEDVVWPEKPER